jgi:hypothetical protein
VYTSQSEGLKRDLQVLNRKHSAGLLVCQMRHRQVVSPEAFVGTETMDKFGFSFRDKRSQESGFVAFEERLFAEEASDLTLYPGTAQWHFNCKPISEELN